MGSIDILVPLDLNNPVFREHLFGLQKPERNAAIDTLRKVWLLSWGQLGSAHFQCKNWRYANPTLAWVCFGEPMN